MPKPADIKLFRSQKINLGIIIFFVCLYVLLTVFNKKHSIIHD